MIEIIALYLFNVCCQKTSCLLVLSLQFILVNVCLNADKVYKRAVVGNVDQVKWRFVLCTN